MKKASLLFAAMLVAGTIFGQYKLRVNEVDEFEGTVKKFTNAVRLGKTTAGSRVTGEVLRIDDNVFFQFTVYSDLGCIIRWKSTAHIKFTDGEVLVMHNLNDTDCGDVSTFSFVLMEGDFSSSEFNTWREDEIAAEKKRVQNILATKKLEKVKFSGSEYYTILEVDQDMQDAFAHLLKLVE